MTEDEILLKAQALADQHLEEIIAARIALMRDADAKGYNPREWKMCDNLLDILAGNTLEYRCWMVQSNPTGL